MIGQGQTISSSRPGAATLLGVVLVVTGCVAQLPNGAGSDAGATTPARPAGAPRGAASGAANTGPTACAGSPYDPRNCGACGNDCGGGECDYGTCKALAPGVLATGQTSPRDIAIDAANVYWLRESPPAVMKCSKQGCNNHPTVVVGLPSGWTLGRLAADGTNVYFTTDSGVFACSVDGCPGGPTVLWQGLAGSVGPIAVDATRVYATEGPGLPTVYSCPIAGCPSGPTIEWSPLIVQPPDLNGGYASEALAVDATTLFGLLDQGAIMAFAPGNAAKETSWLVGQRLGLVDMAIDSTDVFAATGDGLGGQLLRCAKAGCGGMPATLVSTLSTVVRIASDGAFVYISEWGDGQEAKSGRVAKCPVDGCAQGAVPIAGYLNYPLGIAVDDTHVYFTDSGSVPEEDQSPDGRVIAFVK